MRRIALVFVVLLVGCAKRDFRSQEFESAPSELVAAIGINPATLDPAVSQDTITNDLVLHVFEGLVGWSADNRIVPKLAESWTVSDDGLTYTFLLREAKFHNGENVTSYDVLESWERAARKDMASPVVENYLGDIVGMPELLAGKADHLAGVEIVKDLVFRVRLRAPRASFLGKLTYPTAAVLPFTDFGARIFRDFSVPVIIVAVLLDIALTGAFVNAQRAVFVLVHCAETRQEVVESRAAEAAQLSGGAAVRQYLLAAQSECRGEAHPRLRRAGP